MTCLKDMSKGHLLDRNLVPKYSERIVMDVLRTAPSQAKEDKWEVSEEILDIPFLPKTHDIVHIMGYS